MDKLEKLRAVWKFLWLRKKWWLMPIVIILLLLGFLIFFAQPSANTPFIYTAF